MLCIIGAFYIQFENGQEEGVIVQQPTSLRVGTGLYLLLCAC